MPDGRQQPFEPISHYAGPEWNPWAYCQNEPACGHLVQLDIAAIVGKIGDIPSDQFRRQLRRSKCGARARLVIGHR